MVEPCPNTTSQLLQKATKWLTNDNVRTLVDKINDDYLYWTDVKYVQRPEGMSANDLWAVVKLSRMLNRVLVWKKYNIKVPVTNYTQRLCHEFDMNFGGSWGNSSIIPVENREQYLVSSLMEEAIASSQMEGASTTRKVAKEMLRKSISPKTKSEQMICNNYESIRYIVAHKDEPLNSDLLLRIHALMAHNTLDDANDEGRFRTDDNVVVQNELTGEVVHRPPTHTDIEPFVKALCRFANEVQKETYIHPIVKAVVIHFMIAYVHPFTDGNGRTARALFYWYMLKNGYWLTQYLSISRIIYKSKAKYEKAFLYAEADQNDMGYFIAYHLRVLNLAFKELKNYIERKMEQKQSLVNYFKIGNINERQAEIIGLYHNNPKTILTIKELESRFAISHPTAKLDVDGLAERGILAKIAVNKVKFNYIKGDKFDELINNQP